MAHAFPRSTSRGAVAARRRFTLIELLVVVAIIAVLASMLLPSLARARGAAKKATCQSNKKQLYIGFQFFAESTDNWYPPHQIGTGWAGGGAGFGGTGYHGPTWSWAEFVAYEIGGPFRDMAQQGDPGSLLTWEQGQSLFTKVGDLNTWAPMGLYAYHDGTIFDCPESLPAPDGTGARYADYAPIYKGLPNYLPPSMLDPTIERARMHTLVSKPEQRILLMDIGGSDDSNWNNARFSSGRDQYPGSVGTGVKSGGPWSPTGGPWGLGVTVRHLGGSNALYLDGHVSYLGGLHAQNTEFWGYWDHDNAPWAWRSDTYQVY